MHRQPCQLAFAVAVAVDDAAAAVADDVRPAVETCRDPR